MVFSSQLASHCYPEFTVRNPPPVADYFKAV